MTAAVPEVVSRPTIEKANDTFDISLLEIIEVFD